MNYLFDTATFLFLATEQDHLIPSKVNSLINAADHCYLSMASLWEIAIKHSLKKLIFEEPPEVLLPNVMINMNIQKMDITSSHIFGVGKLAHHHKDPFDRLIIAQAIEEKLTIITPDKIFKKYPIKLLW